MLGVLRDWRTEQGILFLGIQDKESQVSRVHGIPLPLVGRHVVVLTRAFVASAVFDVAAAEGGGQGVGGAVGGVRLRMMVGKEEDLRCIGAAVC